MTAEAPGSDEAPPAAAPDLEATHEPVVPKAPWHRRVPDHPVRLVAIAAGLTVVVHYLWVGANRPLGTIDVDEATYLLNAMRFHRALFGPMAGGSGIGPLADQVSKSGTGPLMPLLTVPVLQLLGRSVHHALLLPALAHALAATSVAGIVARMGRRRAALLAGLAILGLPAWLIAARSYTLAGPPAAVLAASVWALLASDRGRRTGPLVLAGLGMGLLTLSRTMAVAFVPGLLLAGAVYLWGTPRALRRAAIAVGAAAAVVVPWWVVTWDVSFGYLFQYGYGDQSAKYGPGPYWVRLLQRWGILTWDVRPLLLLPAIVLAVSALRGAWRRAGRDPKQLGKAVARHRDVLAVWIVVACGYLALLSSSNSGVQFELPLETLMVAGLAGVAHLAAPKVRTGVTGVLLVGLAANFLLVGNWAVGADTIVGPGPPPFAASVYLFGGMYDPPAAIQTSNPQLLSDHGERDRLAAEWWDAHQRVLDAIGDDSAVIAQGDGRMMNGNTLSLAAELRSRPLPPLGVVTIGDTTRPEWRRLVRNGHWSSALIERTRDDLFVPRQEDRDVVERALRDAGWTTRARVPLPDGGDVVVLAPPPPAGDPPGHS